MQKPEVNILIYNVFGAKNRGDSMLFDALLDEIKRAFPHNRITAMAFDPALQEAKYGQYIWRQRVAHNNLNNKIGRIVQIYIMMLCILICLQPKLGFLRYLFPRGQRMSIEAFSACDLAISCPGGYLEDSNFSYFISLLQIGLANALSQVNILAPQSIGPIKSKFGRKLCRKIIADSEQIFVRESYSENFVSKTLGISSTLLKKSGDMAFLFQTVDTNVNDFDEALLGRDDKIFGLTVVDWNFPHCENAEASKAQYISALLGIIDYATSQGYRTVILNQVATDLALSLKLQGLRPNIIVDLVEREPEEMLFLIAKCDIFFGTRFHSCIFCMLAAKAFGAISYLPKTSGILTDMGLSKWAFDIDGVTANDLIRHFKLLEENGPEMNREVVSAVLDYKRNVQNFGDCLPTYLHSTEYEKSS